MPKEFIVAIELGSAKITGVAGHKNLDGSTSILAVAQEDSTSCIRKGVVYNIDKTVLCITNIVKKLETSLKTKVAHVYVGVGGRSIRSVRNVIVKELSEESTVTQDMVTELMDANRGMSYPDQEILDAVTQEYKVDNQYQLDPVGIPCRRLEGNFLNILWRRTFYKNLNRCFDEAGIAIAEMYLAPLALADSVLTENEKRSGCVLVDLGADTTTVSVYYKNILRHLSVVPLGGDNITKDIASLQMEDKDAEAMKLKYGSAFTENSKIDDTQTLPIDKERDVPSRKFIEIVEARVEEIIENAWYQVPNEYMGKLLGGIILTGGGSNMPNIERAFKNHTHVEKVRTARFINQTIHSNIREITARDGRMNTVLGLLEKGDMNCAGAEISNALFDETDKKQGPTTADLHNNPRSASETAGTGIVQTEAEKQKAEEEARRKAEQERAEAERKAEEERERIEREKREKNIWHRAARFLKKFGKDMISDEE